MNTLLEELAREVSLRQQNTSYVPKKTDRYSVLLEEITTQIDHGYRFTPAERERLTTIVCEMKKITVIAPPNVDFDPGNELIM